MNQPVDPLRAAATLLTEIASQLAQYEAERAALTAKIDLALEIASAHGFDRAVVRTVARAMRREQEQPDEKSAVHALYLAAVAVPRS